MRSIIDDSVNYVTEVEGTLKSKSIVFGDPEKCNITICENRDGSQMSITLPNKFDTTKTTVYQQYDMRSVIEAIMELNRRTAFMGSNCSFLTAMQKHQTRPEQYDETTGEPIDIDDPDQFACNRIEDGLPAARNGTHDVPSDIDGTIITTESITALQKAITDLRADYGNLQKEYKLLKEATSIKKFEFTVTFSLDDKNVSYPNSTWGNSWYVNTFTYGIDEATGKKQYQDAQSINSDYTVIKPRWIAKANNTDFKYETLQKIVTDYDVHLLRIYNSKTHIRGYPVENLITDDEKTIKLAFILGSVSAISVVGYPSFIIKANDGALTAMEVHHTANAGEFRTLSEHILSLMGSNLKCVIECRPKEASSD